MPIEIVRNDLSDPTHLFLSLALGGPLQWRVNKLSMFKTRGSSNIKGQCLHAALAGEINLHRPEILLVIPKPTLFSFGKPV
jgi:hypothetical protein